MLSPNIWLVEPGLVKGFVKKAECSRRSCAPEQKDVDQDFKLAFFYDSSAASEISGLPELSSPLEMLGWLGRIEAQNHPAII